MKVWRRSLEKKINNQIEKITLPINSSWYAVVSMSKYMFHVNCL